MITTVTGPYQMLMAGVLTEGFDVRVNHDDEEDLGENKNIFVVSRCKNNTRKYSFMAREYSN